MKVGAIVEGLGERKAVRTLVTKTAKLFGKNVFVSGIVECGNWNALKKHNGLEKYGRLLLADVSCDMLLYLVDLDDGCPVEEFTSMSERAESFSKVVKKQVCIVLMSREYETWFLQDLDGIRERSPEVEWVNGKAFEDPLEHRDAKGIFESYLRLAYRPSIDQDRFTKRLDLTLLLTKSRSLRKLAKHLTKLTYEELNLL